MLFRSRHGDALVTALIKASGVAPAGAPAVVPAADGPQAGDGASQLARLEELHASGAISDDEFERAKKTAPN